MAPDLDWTECVSAPLAFDRARGPPVERSQGGRGLPGCDLGRPAPGPGRGLGRDAVHPELEGVVGGLQVHGHVLAGIAHDEPLEDDPVPSPAELQAGARYRARLLRFHEPRLEGQAEVVALVLEAVPANAAEAQAETLVGCRDGFGGHRVPQAGGSTKNAWYRPSVPLERSKAFGGTPHSSGACAAPTT